MSTLEQCEVHQRLAQMGVTIELNRSVTVISKNHVETNCMFIDQTRPIGCDAV